MGLSKLANTEQAMSALEEKLSLLEAALKKREMDSDFREREMLSKRKEMESWDVLLRLTFYFLSHYLMLLLIIFGIYFFNLKQNIFEGKRIVNCP